MAHFVKRRLRCGMQSICSMDKRRRHYRILTSDAVGWAVALEKYLTLKVPRYKLYHFTCNCIVTERVAAPLGN